MRRVLILRPEPGASATAVGARERGLNPIVVPLFAVKAVEWQARDPASFDALLLTSANAVRFGGEQLAALRGLPLHAVGMATAEAARDAGFTIASTGESGIDRLLGSIEPGLRLLHLCGEHRRVPDGSRQVITPLVVYRANPIAADLSGATGSVALVHSPRAGERFAALIDKAGIARASIAIAAISSAAAETVSQGWAAVESADGPSDHALLALAEQLCKKMAGQ